MKNINILLVFLVLFSVSDLFSQIPLDGQVKNIDNGFVNAAIVKIYGSKHKIIDFTTTKSNGYFKVYFPKENDTITVDISCLGYRNYTKRLSVNNLVNVKNIFVLSDSIVELNEVIVREVLPIKVSKDTTTYSVSKFVDGSEKNIEDILKQLPGIQVSNNGQIMFKGKPIDKVMLEGDDFFSKNYSIITRNMPAFSIEKVDAIENYNENPLLKSITYSDKTVLNLRLRNDLKDIIFGDIKIGTTYKFNKDISSNFFLLSRRKKIGTINNINDVGINPIAEFQIMPSASQSNEIIFFDTNPMSYEYNTLVNTPMINPNRYLNNLSRLSAFTFNYQINSKLKVNSWIYLYKDRLSYSYMNKYEQVSDFNTNNSSFNEDILYVRNPVSLKSSLNVEYNLYKNILIKSNTVLFNNMNNNSLDSRTKLLTKSIFDSFLSQKNYGVSNSTELTYKINDNNAAQLFFQSNINRFRGEMKNASIFYQFSVYDSLSSGIIINQMSNYSDDNNAWRIKFNGKYKGLIYNLSISKITSRQPYSSSIFFNGFTQQSFLNDSVVNNTLFNKKLFLQDLLLNKKNNKYQIIFGLSSVFASFDSNQDNINTSINYNFLTGIKYFLNRKINTSLFFTSNHILPNSQDISTGYRFVNYTTLTRGNKQLKIRLINSIMFNVSYNDIENNINGYIKYILSNNVNPFFRENYLRNSLVLSNVKQALFNVLSHNINSSFDKYIHSIKSRVNVSFVHEVSHYPISQDHAIISTKSYTYKLYISTASKFLFNIEFGVNGNNNTIKYSNISMPQKNLNNLSEYINIRLNSSNHMFSGNIKFEYMKTVISSNVNKTIFSDAWLMFTPNKKAYYLELIGRNLFNAKKNSQINYNGIYINNIESSLLGTMLEIKFEKHFGKKKL